MFQTRGLRLQHSTAKRRQAEQPPFAVSPRTLVPREAVQWEGCCNVVFVPLDVVRYEPRKVHLGQVFGSRYEVLTGLTPGEQVVTTASFLLRTEILKESIGAGCCEVPGPE